jgi:hypothetical protein
LAAARSDPLPLFERDRELALVADAITAAKARAGRLLIVEGDPGAGKSSLLDHAATEAGNEGLQALDARGGVFEQAAGFGVARQLFESILARTDEGQLKRLLDGAAALAGPLLSDNVAASPIEPTQAHHAIYWLLANLAEERPTALLIDDAHWCDRPSLDWLLYLARRIEQLPVLVVLVDLSLEALSAAHGFRAFGQFGQEAPQDKVEGTGEFANSTVELVYVRDDFVVTGALARDFGAEAGDGRAEACDAGRRFAGFLGRRRTGQAWRRRSST